MFADDIALMAETKEDFLYSIHFTPCVNVDYSTLIKTKIGHFGQTSQPEHLLNSNVALHK